MDGQTLIPGAKEMRLRPLFGAAKRTRRCLEALGKVSREEWSPAGRWIEDHGAFLLEEAHALGRPFPRLPGEGGAPRVLRWAREIVREGDAAVPDILRVVRRQTEQTPPTQAELGALPLALRRALMEALLDALDDARQEAEEALGARRLAKDFCEGRLHVLPEGAALARFLDQLDQREDGEALRRAEEDLARRGLSPFQVRQAAEREQAAQGLRVGRLIQSLRQVDRLPWDALNERLNPVAAILRREDTYRRMDGAGRGLYRRRVHEIAKRLGVPEAAVARAALTLAEGKTGAENQAGYYLLERPDRIAADLGKRPGSLRPVGTVRFLAPLYGGAAVALGLGAALGAPWYVWLAIPLCASELLRHLHFAWLRRRYPARPLPRIDEKRLPKDLRVLVVAPALLTSRKQALRMARQLAVWRAANPDPRLDFLLLGDFADAKEPKLPQDDDILLAAKWSVTALNEKQGGGYYYLHRARTWDGGQGAYTGRERKRGALEMLNLYLTQGSAPDPLACFTCDPALLRGRYAYVITLDADTALPPGAALQLAGAMEHPLQKGRVGVIQPRMEVAADRVVTRAQRLLGGRGGVDPYGEAAQDVYQDVLGRGSFVGKGIYQPTAWLDALRGRLPRGRLLSHDLIEGEIVGSALAEDIFLYDGHPARLSGWQKRLHRWTRGDWQLLPFLLDRRLSLLSRHKIWDNLRRSLVPPAQLMLLLTGAALNLPLLFLLGLPWPLRGMGTRLLLLPGKAYTLLDAVARSLYRQFVSHRGLLSWVTADQAEGKERPALASVLFQALSGAGMIACALRPGPFWPGALLGMGWAGGVLLTDWLDGKARASSPMTPDMEKAVRSLARDTWRFFEDTVGPATLYLPPDNLQLDPDKGIALRTSPTNMGLYLLSCCAARELGLVTTAELAGRIGQALTTMEGLSAWRGHLYNWYDLQDGAPLAPAFVSTVDSGNLAGCLLCCAQMLRLRLGELAEDHRALPARLDALARRMDFAALYDKKTHLFFVGWDVRENRPTGAHYDSLASEARLASFVAILLGQVEGKHWRYLNRAVVRAGGGTALLSWGGTLFEYLMPHLLLPLVPGTLLGEGCASAVRAQISADPSRPFGISESGYYAFDPDLNYQYRAFGLPILARTCETAGQVIAPYASVLALPFFPRAAGDNLLRMDRLGWRGKYGLYEAVDYTPRRLESGPRIVKSHMAHHQGMILCSICNALKDGALWRAFMTPPDARAWAGLLQERPAAAPRRGTPPPPLRADGPEDAPLRRAPRPGLPVDAQLLSGGGLRWLLTEKGQGKLQWGDMLLTRFDPEAGALTGPQFYVRDKKTGVALPIALSGSALFEEGAARYALVHEALKITLVCCVDPLLSMAVAAIQVENLGLEDREIELISFLEIAQGDEKGDRAHPNYRDLSVRVLPWGKHGLLSQRLPREAGETCPWIGHVAAGEILSLRRQGDRALFLGRSGSYARPEQVAKDPEDCPMRTGDVIAPCLSLRAGVRAPGGGRATVYFMTLCREKREALDQLSLTADRARAAYALAFTQERMTLRFLHLDGRTLGLYQQMLGAALLNGQPHQAMLPSAGSGALWRYGVSGEYPVLLLNLLGGPDRALIRHALRFHGYLRTKGEPLDLVIFCPEEGEYQRPCRDTAAHLVALSEERDLVGAAGGVFLVSGTETEEQAVESLAKLTLRSGQGLARQLSALRLALPRETPAALAPAFPGPVPPLQDAQAFGGFTEEGGYCVARPAPAPWYQLLCGPAFGSLACEGALLQSWAGNSRLDPITRPCPDPHRAPASEEIFLRDDTGAVYALIGCPALYEPGVAAYRVQAGKIQAEVTVFSHGELPLGVRAVTLRSEEETTAQLHYFARFSLGERGESTRCRAAADGFVFAHNGDHPGVAYCALPDARAQALAPAACFGVTGQPVPLALLHSVQGVGSVGALTCEVALRPRETAKRTVILGFAATEDQARRDSDRLWTEGASHALRGVRAQWGARLQGMQCFLGDAGLERMMNLWLPYQVWSARLLARMGPYQPGGAFGFRDQLQDLLILLHTDPAAARAHLLRCAAHQFPEGDVQHWWHPEKRGARTRVRDDRLFLPYITALYVRITGDEGILSEKASYLLSPPLNEGEITRYEEPETSADEETLFQHCLRAIDSVALGARDLPLMGGGDWNDGMNRVGGKSGESVWLGFFLALTLKEFLPLCPPDLRDRYRALRHRVLDGAESAWTGAWYLRAWYDDGRPLGGPDTRPPRIDLISQAFAALAGAPRHHAREAVGRAVELLYDREAGMVRLLDPPFAPEENAGYIGAYLPGVRENGGQYTHAVPWLILALCQLGQGALAWEIARAILPVFHSDTEEKARVYQIEPYVLAGDVYAGENRGRGGWSWYSGSAAWLYYAALTGLLGFEKRGDRARLVPCAEPGMEEFTLAYRFGGANYHFTAAHGVLFPTLDGTKLDDGWVPLIDDGRTHEARFPLREGG